MQKKPYRDLYALFRHEPGAEDYFNRLPDYVQDQIAARYLTVDSMERLQSCAARMMQGPGPETVALIPEIGSQIYPTPFSWS